MSRTMLLRLMALAVLILALAAVPSAPAATVRDDASTGDDTPALNVDLLDDSEDPADDSDDACVADDQSDDGSQDTTDDESDAATRSRAASADSSDGSGDDDATPADDSAGGETSDDETSDEDAVDPCEDTIDVPTTTLRLRLIDILRSGVDGGTFSVTGPATVRQELVLASGGATAAARRATTKSAKVVGVATKKVRSAGRVHLVVRLTTAGRRALRRGLGRRQLTLRTTVRPTRGAVQTRTRAVVLRRG